jgi:hypothetical protein
VWNNNTIGRYLDKQTQKEIFIFVSILVGLIVITLFLSQYFYNAFFGPFYTDSSTLLSVTDQTIPYRYYVTIEGEESLPTGLQEIEERADKVTADYLALAINKRLLLIKVPPGKTGTRFTGKLIAIPEGEHKEFIAKLKPDQQGVFLPVMLDTVDSFYGGLIVIILIGVPIFVAVLCYLIALLMWWLNIGWHPSIRALRRYGTPLKVANHIEDELRSGQRLSLGAAIMTSSWWLSFNGNRVDITTLQDIVWIYPQKIEHKRNFVTYKKTYAAIICDRHKKKIVTACDSLQEAQQIVQVIYRRVPWIFAGYDKSLNRVWNSGKNHQKMVQKVQERRQTVISAKNDNPIMT